MKYLNLPSPWGKKEKEFWFSEQSIQRSYSEEVEKKILALSGLYDVEKYGALSIDPNKYSLYLIRSKHFDANKKTVLITGGVHGYETSGVHGALLFMEKFAANYFNNFNFLCAPCLSPWGYETINRWNPQALDPNRSFYENSPAEECRFFLQLMEKYQDQIFVHFDLHETTDTDETIFRPALEKRDGVVKEPSEIPDGFYVVGLSHRPQSDFQKAIIESVRKVTHIAPCDAQGMLIGVPVESEGVINYDMKKLFLCGGFSNALYSTTTEVYPDSPKVTAENCNLAQVMAITGGLDYVLSKNNIEV